MNKTTVKDSSIEEDQMPIFSGNENSSSKEPTFGKRKWVQKFDYDTKTICVNLSELHGQPQDTAYAFINMNLDKVIELVGAENRYQVILTIQACFMSIVMAMIIYSASFLITNPVFKCVIDGVKEECKETEWCNLYKVDYLNGKAVLGEINFKYPGWTKTKNLICDDSNLREIFNYIMIFIPALLVLISSVISDAMGRVFTLKSFTWVICTLALVGFWIPNIWVKVIAMSIFIGEEQTVCTLFTYIINESTTTKSTWRSAAIGIYFCFFALGGVLVSLLSYVVQDPDYLYLIIVILCLVFSIPMIWTVHESPKQLHKMGKFKSLIEGLLYMSKVNGNEKSHQELAEATDLSGIDLEVLRKCRIETRISCKERGQLLWFNLKVIFSKEYCVSIIGYLMLCGSLRTINNCAVFAIGDIGPELAVNTMALSGMEAIAYLTATFFAAKIPRKKAAIFSLIGI